MGMGANTPQVGSLYGGGALPPNAATQQAGAGAAGALPPGLQNLTPEQQMQLMKMAQGQYQMPPAMIKNAAQVSQQGLEMGNLDRSQRLADQLRADAGQQLQGVQAGKRFVAPGALNLIGSLGQTIAGGMQANEIAKKRQAMVDLGKTNTEAILNEANQGR